jgi:hypothetical protein
MQDEFAFDKIFHIRNTYLKATINKKLWRKAVEKK